MGSIRLRKDGKTIVVDENTTGAELKKMLDLPSDSILINAMNKMIPDNALIKNYVKDGEEIAAEPNYIYW
jgi:hypothetical protein